MSNSGFCNVSNIKSCLHLLSSELEILGLPLISYNEEFVVDLINTSWALVSSSKKQILIIGELNEKIINLERKNVALEDGKRKHLSVMENEKNKFLKLKESLSSVSELKEILTNELQDFKKELALVQGTLSGQLLQHQHEIRRKDRLIEELQTKLVNLLGTENQMKKCGGLLNDEIKNDFSHDSVHTNYILDLRNNIELLLNENVSLRSSIISIYLTILRYKSRDFDSEIKIKLFNIPYQTIINEIENDIKSLLH